MPFTTTDIQGLLIFEPAVYKDDRGFFFESYNEQTFQKQGLDMRFVQDNQSFSYYGVIRGLHYQLEPHAQTKLVRVLEGRVLDVAVDIRPGSATYGRWVGETLTAETGEQLWVPRGFAHGYVTLTDDTELFYKVDGDYAPTLEGGLIWNDPDIGIAWPLDVEPVLSDKDKVLPRLKDMPKAAF